MRVETTLDKVTLTPSEIQTVLKAHIEATLNRKVSGEVVLSQSGRSNSVSAYAELKPIYATGGMLDVPNTLIGERG